MGDQLFNQLERWHGEEPWGSVLDAGTGEHSLKWLLTLSTSRWAAVTGDVKRKVSMEASFRQDLRAEDKIVVGNWQDPVFLLGESYDTVIADYLLGAVDGFAPYFQAQLFGRLRPHVRKRLYVIGLEPFPDRASDEGSALILEIARLRDACILLAGHRCYREYPLDWVVRQLNGAGFLVERTRRLPILYGERYVKSQLQVCRRKLKWFGDQKVAGKMRDHIDSLERRALKYVTKNGRIRAGEDYIVQASPI